MRILMGLIAFSLLTSFGCRTAPPASPGGGPGVTAGGGPGISAGGSAGGVDALKADLTRLVDDQSLGVQPLVRNATAIVRERCLGKSWADVAAALERQGLPPTRENKSQGLTIRRHLVRSDARTAGKLSFDCFVEFQEDWRAAPATQEGQVLAATAGLRAKIGRPYADVVQAQPPVPENVVEQILLRPEVAEAAATFSNLDAIEVTYGPIRNRWSERVPSGFHLRYDLSIDGTDQIGGRRVYFTVASGLDPPQKWDGTPLPEGFAPQDTLGEVVASASTEWWHGDAATIAANKAKYLGKN